LYQKEEQGMTITRAAAVVAAILVFDTVLPAAVVYTLNNRRFFPAADGTVSEANSNPFTASTVDSVTTHYTDPLTTNQFDAVSGVTGSPFQVAAKNSVTINQPTTSSCCGILSLVSSAMNDSSVLVTGGTGTAYLLPTFRIHGTFDDNNSSLELSASTCAGNASCVLSSAAFTVTPGLQTVDTLFTPGITSSTQFDFGTPFNFFFFLEAGIQYLGPQANPGGTSTADLRMELVGIRVTDAGGVTIPGANISSAFLEIAAPEPGSAVLSGLTLLSAIGVALYRAKRVAFFRA
jgi:hypothetical protein